MKYAKFFSFAFMMLLFVCGANAGEGDLTQVATEAGSATLETISGWLSAMPQWLHAITAVVTAATAITALTPTKSDDVVIGKILKVLNFLAGNFLKNKNAK